MRHLALPFFCLVFLGIALCEAFASGISTRFGAAFMAAAIVWAVLAYIEIRAAWFAEAVQRRRSERHRTPLPSDDTH